MGLNFEAIDTIGERSGEKKKESIKDIKSRRKLEYLNDVENQRNRNRIEEGRFQTTEILRDIKNGVNIYRVVERCIRCIADMTGNEAFYLQAISDVKAVYSKKPSQSELIAKEHKKTLDILSSLYKQKREVTDPIRKAEIGRLITANETKVIQLEEQYSQLIKQPQAKGE